MTQFEDLNLNQLRKIVHEYNLHNTITSYSKLKKSDLITEIKKFLYIEDEQIKAHPKNYEVKAPYTTATKKAFTKSYESLLKLQNVADVDPNLLKFYKDNMQKQRKPTKKQQEKIKNFVNNFDEAIKAKPEKKSKKKSKKVEEQAEIKQAEEEVFNAEDAIKKLQEMISKKEDDIKFWNNKLEGKGMSGGRRLPPDPNLTLQQYYDRYGKPLERSAPQFGEGPAGDFKYKEYMDRVMYNYERRKQGWSPIGAPSQAELTARQKRIEEYIRKEQEYQKSPEFYYKTFVEGQENDEIYCPFNNQGGIDLDKWSGKPTGFKTTKEQCMMNTFYNTKTGKLDSETALKRERALKDAQNREVSGWEQFRRGFTGSLETFAKPLLDVASVIPGVGAVARGLSTAIDFIPSAEKSVSVGEGLLGRARPPKIFGNGKPNGYALHAILIKKSVPLEKAKEHAQEILKSKKQFYRETKNQYRFRNIPKTKFIKKTFKSKKINPDITLVFGKLSPENMHLEGSGLFDWIKKGVKKVKEFFSPRLDSYNNTSTNTIKKFGNLPINSLQIYRTPIASVLETVLNFISLGKFTELKRKAGFDKLFHLALVANVNGKNIIMEKNEAVNVSTSYKTSKDTEVFNIPINKPITIYELLEKARNKVGDKTFFDYNAFTNNCQFFIKYLLENSDLYSEGAKNFLFQDIKSIYEGLPSYVPKIAKAVTTTGAIFNKITGQGLCPSKPKVELPQPVSRLRRTGMDSPFPIRQLSIEMSEMPAAMTATTLPAAMTATLPGVVAQRAQRAQSPELIRKASVKDAGITIKPQIAKRQQSPKKPSSKPQSFRAATKAEKARISRHNPLVEASSRKLPIEPIKPIKPIKKSGRGKKQKKYN
jgi:hypothetical protein